MIYVANFKSNDIGIYSIERRGLGLKGSVRDGVEQPRAIAFDRNETLYVANRATITEYAGGRGRPVTTISTGVAAPSALALDYNQNLYALNDNNTITVYALGTTKPAMTISQGLAYPQAMTFGYEDGDLYVANCPSCESKLHRRAKKLPDSINIYSTSNGSLIRTITKGIQQPKAMYSTSQDLLVANYSSSSVTVYDNTSFALVTKITQAVDKPDALGYDSTGGYIFVGNEGDVTTYDASNFTYLLGYAFQVTAPQVILSDDALDLWIAGGSSNAIYGYFCGGSGPLPEGVTTKDIDDPVSLAFGP